MVLTPAEYVILTIGGVNATARALNRSPAAVSKWKRPRTEKGTGGEIPRSVRKHILDYAKKNALDITLKDLEYGREVRL